MLAELMVTAIVAGQEALERTPEQLDVLAEAGVVDAGRLRPARDPRAGSSRGSPARTPATRRSRTRPPRRATARLHVDSRFRYCTSCIVTGRELDPRAVAPRLEELGDSIAVVGDATMLKVHVHTDTPSRARAVCAEHGDVHQFEFTDMRRQIAERDVRLAGGAGVRTGVVAVACGDGHRRAVRRRGGPGRRRRSDPQPLDQRDPRGHPRDPRRGGDRAAQLAERDPRRRGGRAARRSAGPGRGFDLPAGRPGGARRRSRPRRDGRRERLPDGGRARGDQRRAGGGGRPR